MGGAACDKAELDIHTDIGGTTMTTRQVLCADDGMLLTNGETFCRTVWLAVGADAGAWTEVPESEAPDEDGDGA